MSPLKLENTTSSVTSQAPVSRLDGKLLPKQMFSNFNVRDNSHPLIFSSSHPLILLCFQRKGAGFIGELLAVEIGQCWTLTDFPLSKLGVTTEALHFFQLKLRASKLFATFPGIPDCSVMPERVSNSRSFPSALS